MFNIHFGIPEMYDYWKRISSNVKTGKCSNVELKTYKMLVKALNNLANDPRYPGLKSHEIEQLSKRYGMKVWESYLENNVSVAKRIFWVYGPKRNDITVIGIEQHPNSKSNAYSKITLSAINNNDSEE